ncbi:S49 family peptidase [Mucilaginibacter sp.]|uniref:S49 family peptidase n=1 Tax=Mucilaginibacter sp. TaxID=1882438 RepID=UPI0035BC511F
MSDFRLISALLRHTWLIDPAWAEENQPAVAKLLKGKSTGFQTSDRRSPEERVAVLNRMEGSILFAPGYYSGFQNAPEGSIAYIDVTGPILKYGYCGNGSYELNQIVREAYATPNIKALFFEYDTPGGQVDGIATFGDTIFNSPKPNLGFVNDGMCCSGGIWLGTANQELYASQDLDTIGSIGVYQSWYDQTQYLKNLGIKRIDRYAPQSTEKNKVSKDAAAGNYKLLDEELFAVAEKFINKIQLHRGDRLKGSHEEWNKGKASSALWAQKTGLIDGIITREKALERLEALCDGEQDLRASSSPIIKSIEFTQSTDMKFPKVALLAGKADPTEAELSAANAELAEAGITGVALMPETVVNEAARVTGELATERANVTKLQGELNVANKAKGDLETEKATLISDKSDLEQKIASLPGGMSKKVGETDPDPEKTEAEKQKETIAGFSHNQYINSFLNGR